MSNRHGKTIKSIAEVLVSNIATIIAGVIIGFLIPKVLDVEGYGFYKTFTLYVTYAGIFSLGIIDGIVLEYGGVDYKDYDKRLFRGIFKCYSLVHIFWSFILLVISVLVNDINYSFIILMIAIYLYFGNMVGYFQQISQITQRFKEYSISKIIQSFMKIIGGLIVITIFYMTKKFVDYKIYVFLTTIGFFIVTLGYLYIYRRIIFGISCSIKDTSRYVIHLSKIGFPLMIANLCSMLILTLDRQFVNLLFSNSEYAVYAFAYNMLSLVTVATSAISTVLYPILKRTTLNTLKDSFDELVSIVLTFVYGALLLYFPLYKFIYWFLPKYSSSLPIFRIIFPGLAISSAINVVMHNYYKTLGMNNLFFKKGIVVLVISAIANEFAYLIFKTTFAVSLASVITMVIWYLYVEQLFVDKYEYKRMRNLIYMLIMMFIFYISTSFNNIIIASTCYLLMYFVLTYLIQKQTILHFKKVLLKK